jgi:IS5 family transposase
MVGRVRRQSSLFYVAFGAEASLIKDDLLDSISPLLDEPELIALVADALGRRASQSRKTGRYGVAPDRVLRCIVLQKIKGWSLRELERELRCGLAYRHFTGFDHDRIPRYSTFSRTFATVGEDVVHRIHERVVDRARREGIARGRKLRTDTTVVESNIHYPTDSTLLQDGVRVLTRAVERLKAECASGAVKMVDRTRATKHRVLEITRAAKAFNDGSRTRLQEGYRGLLGIARGVVRKAKEIIRSVDAGRVSTRR